MSDRDERGTSERPSEPTGAVSDRDERGTSEAVSQEPAKPLLTVVNPDATPEEIAALVALFSALGSSEAPAPKPTAEWSSNHRRVRANHGHGAGGWRSSGLPLR